ncbi:MAG: phosphoserine phosphatase SerB [Myxococcales bacterium]|nr:phosphoserine phosphatase SerB [Myxococcales bacterium]
MTTENHSDRIVLNIAGADRPGVTARLTQIIAEEKAQLVTIGQSVLHGYLMLSAIIDIPAESRALSRLLFAVSELGLRLDVTTYRPEHAQKHHDNPVLTVTMLGELATGRCIADVTSFLAQRDMNILDIRSLTDERLAGLELFVELPGGSEMKDAALAELRGEILGLGRTLGVDIAVQKDDIFRRNKRLVCMDVDSTFMRGELIDELADLCGVRDRVAAITERAMRGELLFEDALRERVRLLEGLEVQRALELAASIETTPGADRFATTLKSLGFRVGLVSGGFDFFVDKLKERFGLDFAFANELEVENGRFTGRVQGTIVTPERKGQILRDMTKIYKFRLEQSIAIGDGANDMLMLQTAGLGIAYRGKPKLQAVADMSLNHNVELDTLLFLMGFTGRELAWLERE